MSQGLFSLSNIASNQTVGRIQTSRGQAYAATPMLAQVIPEHAPQIRSRTRASQIGVRNFDNWVHVSFIMLLSLLGTAVDADVACAAPEFGSDCGSGVGFLADVDHTLLQVGPDRLDDVVIDRALDVCARTWR